MLINAGDGGGESSRRRVGGGHEPGSRHGTPLSISWPGGCALDWEERERVSRAALERCSQTTTARGIEGRR